jgi:hypothetical protein
MMSETSKSDAEYERRRRLLEEHRGRMQKGFRRALFGLGSDVLPLGGAVDKLHDAVTKKDHE